VAPILVIALVVKRRGKGKEETIVRTTGAPTLKETTTFTKSRDCVFISHVEGDAKVALEIAQGLEQAGYKTWYYERDSVAGLSYLLQTMHAIEQSVAVVLIISSHSLSSNQVTKEVIRTHEAGKLFIPLLDGISHLEFQQRQPEWREAIGSATSLSIPKQGISSILPRIIDGLASLGVKKRDESASLGA
jgi:aspartate/tyrosine/aromatic aminotransferase